MKTMETNDKILDKNGSYHSVKNRGRGGHAKTTSIPRKNSSLDGTLIPRRQLIMRKYGKSLFLLRKTMVNNVQEHS